LQVVAVQLALQVDRQDALVAQRIDRHQIHRARQTRPSRLALAVLMTSTRLNMSPGNWL
jgi:hypothetical protein